MREFNLVSTPFASGVAWLVNVLLELGVRTTHVSTRYPRGHWERGAGAVEDEMTGEAREFMGWHLPIVFNRPGPLRLEPGLEVFWEHRLDLARHTHRPTIVFVRDPRDAIYSIHRRDFASTRPFPSYLARPDRFPDHFPGLFDLPPADTWAAWHTLWLGLQVTTPILFVQFEAMRANPVPGVQQVLAFLGLERPADDIERALAASTFERAREAMRLQEQKTGTVRETARRGQTGEWRETYTPETLQWFTGPARHVMTQLGYAPEGLGEPWPDAAGLLDAATPIAAPIADAMAQAQAHWQAGQSAAASAALARAATAAGSDLASRLQLATEAVAIDWTLKILGPELAHGPTGAATLNAYRGFLRRFATWTPVEQLLLAAVDHLPDAILRPAHEPAPALVPNSDDPPQLVQSDYRGFNLVRFRKQVHAIAQSLGPIDLFALSGEDWSALQAYGGILSGPNAASVRAAVDQLCTTGQTPRPGPPPTPETIALTPTRLDLQPIPSLEPTGAKTVPGSPFVLNFDA